MHKHTRNSPNFPLDPDTSLPKPASAIGEAAAARRAKWGRAPPTAPSPAAVAQALVSYQQVRELATARKISSKCLAFSCS